MIFSNKSLEFSLPVWLFAFLFIIFISALSETLAIDMDVKCAVYRDDSNTNGDNVDVRIFLLGLKPNTEYTAVVIPDHNQPITVTAQTDYEGIFWYVAKIPSGDLSLLFKVEIYEGNSTDGNIIVKGDDEAPCYEIDLQG